MLKILFFEIEKCQNSPFLADRDLMLVVAPSVLLSSCRSLYCRRDLLLSRSAAVRRVPFLVAICHRARARPAAVPRRRQVPFVVTDLHFMFLIYLSIYLLLIISILSINYYNY